MTPNNKAIYARLGMVAEIAQEKLEKKYSDKVANTQIKALMGQVRVVETEIKIANTMIKADEHFRRFGEKIKMRNIELKPFAENELK